MVDRPGRFQRAGQPGLAEPDSAARNDENHTSGAWCALWIARDAQDARGRGLRSQDRGRTDNQEPPSCARPAAGIRLPVSFSREWKTPCERLKAAYDLGLERSS